MCATRGGSQVSAGVLGAQPLDGASEGGSAKLGAVVGRRRAQLPTRRCQVAGHRVHQSGGVGRPAGLSWVTWTAPQTKALATSIAVYRQTRPRAPVSRADVEMALLAILIVAIFLAARLIQGVLDFLDRGIYIGKHPGLFPSMVFDSYEDEHYDGERSHKEQKNS